MDTSLGIRKQHEIMDEISVSEAEHPKYSLAVEVLGIWYILHAVIYDLCLVWGSVVNIPPGDRKQTLGLSKDELVERRERRGWEFGNWGFS